MLILGNVKAKAVMHSLPDLNAYTNLETLHVLQATLADIVEKAYSLTPSDTLRNVEAKAEIDTLH